MYKFLIDRKEITIQSKVYKNVFETFLDQDTVKNRRRRIPKMEPLKFYKKSEDMKKHE